MTNQEKLATLKDYELAEVIVLLALHTDCIQHRSGASENLDAIDSAEDTAELIINWLNGTYDEEKGFGFYPGELVFLKPENMQQFDYLEGSKKTILEVVGEFNDDEEELEECL